MGGAIVKPAEKYGADLDGADDRLDAILRRLASAPLDRSLDGLEAGVERGIELRRLQARSAAALRPVAIVSIGLAMAIGIAAGSLATPDRRDGRPAGIFTEIADLAPSSLLENI